MDKVSLWPPDKDGMEADVAEEESDILDSDSDSDSAIEEAVLPVLVVAKLELVELPHKSAVFERRQLAGTSEASV